MESVAPIFRHARGMLIFLAFCAAFSSLWSLEAQTARELETYRIGVQATSGATRTLEEWRTTEQTLNEASARQAFPFRFTIIPEAGGNVANSIDAGRIDLLLSDPAAFVVAEVDYGARAILSTARIVDGRSVDRTGALIFAKADQPFSDLSDLQGANVMAVSPSDFSGWWLAAQEFRRFRLDPMDHLGEVLFSGGNEREVVYAVQSGLVSAGVIRAGALEELAGAGVVRLSEFRPISPQRIDGFPYFVSTPLYPERVLSALPHVPEPVLSLVINTLLESDPSIASGQSGMEVAWQAPENYQNVHELLVSLRAAPYENYLWQATVRIYALYRWQILAVLCAVLGSLTFLAHQARRNWALAEAHRNVLKSESRSKVFYRSAVEEHTVFCMLNRDGKISHVNGRFCDLAGQPRQALMGRELSTLLSTHDQALLTDEIQQSMDLKTPWNGHLRIKKTDGSYSWAQCMVIPVTGVEDKLSEIALVATDMTSTQIDLVEATFTDTLELIEDPIIVLNPLSLSILHCNKAAEKTLIEERVGGNWRNRPIEELITSEDLKALHARRDAVVEGPNRRLKWEVDTKAKISYEISLEYVVPEMDKPSLIVMYRDITDRKAAELAKSEFVSTVSHELRTPLTSMKGAIAIASSGKAGEVSPQVQQLLGMASRNTDRLFILINDILDLEKIEAQKMKYNFETLDLEELVEQAIKANHYYAENLKVNLVAEIDPASAPYVTIGDRNRLMQVMDNLISNASKFSHPDSQVLIRLLRCNGWIRLSIRDFGTGIPEAAQLKIFGKFVQGDSSDIRAKGGTGLGLAIVKPIVEAHKGAISFFSQEGVGSEFFVDLPRLDGDEVIKVDTPAELIATGFLHDADPSQEIVVSAFTGSALIEAFERGLRRSGWATDLEAGHVTTNQILNGSGVLGRAIAMNLLDVDCRTLLSDLIEQNVIKNSPVCFFEASMERGLSPDLRTGARGSSAISEWLVSIPGTIVGAGKQVPVIKVLVISDEDLPIADEDVVRITRVRDLNDPRSMGNLETYDLVLHLTETAETCTALILPTAKGVLEDQLPLTVFAGQKTDVAVHLGVVSKFSLKNNTQTRRARGR